jgi:predicted transposase YdaD
MVKEEKTMAKRFIDEDEQERINTELRKAVEKGISMAVENDNKYYECIRKQTEILETQYEIGYKLLAEGIDRLRVMRITGLLKHEIDTLVVSLENEKKEGINETTKELVKKMLAEKIDVPIIMRIAELSRTDVERIEQTIG